MCLKIAGSILVVVMLAIVLANQNDAGDRPAEAGGGTSKDAAALVAGEPEPKSDPLDEVLRLRESLDGMKRRVASELRRSQGLFVVGTDIVIGGKPIGGMAPGGQTFRFPPQMSREEEEWIVLAGELRDEGCVELLLNRIADPGPVHLLSMTLHRQGCPAYYFLCKIGLPACQPALNRIPLEPDDRIRDYLTRLLQRCLGNSEARSRLVALKEKCETDETRERVQKAIEQCDAKPLPHQTAYGA
jgi:hypothetical protein